MVFNSATVAAVADVSADTWQQIWRIPPSQRIDTQQLLDIAFCFPMHQLSRLVLCLWTFMCHPSSDDSFYSYTYESFSASSSSSSSSSDLDDDDRLAFDHNRYNHPDYSDDDRSSLSYDDYYDHYAHSD